MLEGINRNLISLTEGELGSFQGVKSAIIEGIVRSDQNGYWLIYDGVKYTLPEELSIRSGDLVRIRVFINREGEVIGAQRLDVNREVGLASQSMSVYNRGGAIIAREEWLGDLVGKLTELFMSVNVGGSHVDRIMSFLQQFINEPASFVLAYRRLVDIIQQAVQQGVIDGTWLEKLSSYIIRSGQDISYERIRDLFEQHIKAMQFEHIAITQTDGDVWISDGGKDILLFRTLPQLMQDESFIDFLKRMGYEKEFQRIVELISSRPVTNQVINLVHNNYYYFSFELPLRMEEGFEWARIHAFLSEGHKKGSTGTKGKNPYFIVAMDLSLTRLGKIWVDLKQFEDNLECTFKVTQPDIKHAFESVLEELKSRFVDLGYRNVAVQVSVWDGDSKSMTWNLFNIHSGKGWRA